MIQQNPVLLFRANTRSLAENKAHKLHATFNFNDPNSSFGALTALNDETLAAGDVIEKVLLSGTAVMVIPIIGAAECRFKDNAPQIIVPGEAFTYYSHSESNLSINNPYEGSQINFLYITFSAPVRDEVLLPNDFLIANANLAIHNRFHKLFESFQNGLSTHIGIFNSSSDTVYTPKNQSNGIFIFVISGVFEIQGNIMEERDGMALWETSETDIQALADNAILLLIEAPLTGLSSI